MSEPPGAISERWRDPATGCDIPVLDLAEYLAGEQGARERLGRELREALEEVGFFYVVNHDVPKALIDRTFAETARFHSIPTEEKNKIAINECHVGYLGFGEEASRTSEHYTGTIKPDVAEAYFMLRDRAPRPLDVKNQWPDNLPGFRETLVAYFEAAEALFRRSLPIFAASLDLPPDYFAPAFGEYEALSMLRVSHFRANDQLETNQFHLAPHTDSTFVTMLPTTEVPGLELLGPGTPPAAACRSHEATASARRSGTRSRPCVSPAPCPPPGPVCARPRPAAARPPFSLMVASVAAVTGAPKSSAITCDSRSSGRKWAC